MFVLACALADLHSVSRTAKIQTQKQSRHSSNEPVQALGKGITLDRPLSRSHEINAVVRDAAVAAAGYQGTPAPNQWFGGPEFTTNAILFGRFNVSIREGSLVLQDASGSVVDTLNYGGLVDPWAAFLRSEAAISGRRA